MEHVVNTKNNKKSTQTGHKPSSLKQVLLMPYLYVQFDKAFDAIM